MRNGRILKHIDQGSMTGVEIGPAWAPLCPKAEGWDVRVLDAFTTEQLRHKCGADRSIVTRISRIEEVDLHGPAANIDILVDHASLDFIVSSHNFEHLPDPVEFLIAAALVLKPGGVLSMAIPDHRYIFDRDRPASRLGELLEAYQECRIKPTPRQVFECEVFRTDAKAGALAERWENWRAPLGEYTDTHCWCFTPASLTEILAQLRALGLIRLETVEITGTYGFEFDAHLRRAE